MLERVGATVVQILSWSVSSTCLLCLYMCVYLSSIGVFLSLCISVYSVILLCALGSAPLTPISDRSNKDVLTYICKAVIYNVSSAVF